MSSNEASSLNRSRILFGLLALVFIGGLLSLNDALLYTPDSARYLIWAETLSQFDGYNDTASPEPTRYVVHAPLYSVLLVPAAWIAPGSVVAAKAVNLVLALLLLWLVYQWVGETLGGMAGLAVSVFLGTHSLFLIYATQVLSEIPFAIAVVLALREVRRLESLREKTTYAHMAGLVLSLGAGMFLREVGVTIVAGLVLMWMLRRQWKIVVWTAGVCLLLYALWFVRNEVVVAGFEQPPLRNSKLFVAHLYTPESYSLAAEFAARAAVNAKVYAGHISTFLFAPDYVRQSHGLVSLDFFLVRWIASAMPILGPLYLLMTISGIAAGIWFGWKSNAVVRHLVFILACYALPILVYPINDVRFLFIIVLLSSVLLAAGYNEVSKRMSSIGINVRSLWLSLPAALFFLIPNISWDVSYIVNNWRYVHDADAQLADPGTPEYYRKRISEAGRWIDEHAPGNAAVLTRWKEIGLWVGNRKVVDVDPQLTPDSFDRMVRDYNVRYVATATQKGGLRENEQQLEYSSRFASLLVHKSGSVEVVELTPRTYETITVPVDVDPNDSLRMFRRALHELRRGDPVEAESLLAGVQSRVGRFGSIIFNLAVAKELSGRYDDALDMFTRFRSIPQAGSLIQQAWYHQEIISRIRAAQLETNPEERASKFHVAAVNYWEVGLRGACFRMLDSALASKPDYFPALIFRSIFHYQDGSHRQSTEFLRRAEKVNSGNVLVRVVTAVLRIDEELAHVGDRRRRSELLIKKGEAFLEADMREDAIDAWRSVLAEDPSNVVALRGLTRLYMEKRRFGPARDFALKWLAVAPGDTEAQTSLAELQSRWGD